MSAYPVELAVDVLLADGSPARIRPIRPDDADGLVAFHEKLSAESVYRRFFGLHPHLRREEVARFTCVDYVERLALVAEIDGELVAVARYDREPGRGRAEVAFVVADAMQGLGLATVLLEHLASAARRRGITEFFAETLASNQPMQEVFKNAGFACVQRWDRGVVDVSFPIAPTQHYLDAVTGRGLAAVHRSLRSLIDTAATDAAVGHTPGARLGVICHSGAVAMACRSVTNGTTMLVLAGDEVDVDVCDLLAGLAMDDATAVIALVAVQPSRPRRFVTVARAAARRKPLLAVLASTPASSPFGDTAEIWAQIGIDVVYGIEALADRVEQLQDEARLGAWQPPMGAALVDLAGCDPAAARAAIDRQQPMKEGPQRLTAPVTTEILASYGVALGSLPANGSSDGLSLTVREDPVMGLHARLGTGRAVLLPLTGRDALDIVKAAAPSCPDPDLLADVVLRATRLVDDQADICRLDLSLFPGAVGTCGVPELWVGPIRSSDDDPFVRRVATPVGRHPTQR